MSNMSRFVKDLEGIINANSMENGSDTPDFIIATYLIHCLETFNAAVQHRDKWYSFKPWSHSTDDGWQMPLGEVGPNDEHPRHTQTGSDK